MDSAEKNQKAALKKEQGLEKVWQSCDMRGVMICVDE